MTPISFLHPDSDLLFWNKQDSKVFGDSAGSSSPNPWFKQNYLIPWAVAGVAVAVTWLFPFINNRATMARISDLEFDHAQFSQLTARISSAEQEFSQQKDDIRNFSALFTSAVVAYPFTFNLQRSIPAKVNLNSFVLDDSSFNICAFGPDYESLEDLIDLVKDMPAVDANSVRFTNIAADPSALGSSANCQSLSSLQPLSISFKGSFLNITPIELEALYASASDYVHYHKLKLYNSLLKKVGGSF